jgi:type II secretory pathway component PulF
VVGLLGSLGKEEIVRSNDFLELIETLSTLLEAGIGLYEALVFISGQGQPCSKLAKELASELNKGSNLSTALKKHSALTPNRYSLIIAMLKMGERIGNIGEALKLLVSYLKNKKIVRDKIISALIYPALIMVVMFLGGLALVLLVIPRISEAVAELGDFGEVITALNSLGYLMLGSIVVIVLLVTTHILLLKYYSTYRYYTGKTLLRIPIFKNFFATSFYWHFSFYMETLLAGGISLENALSEASNLNGNLYLKKELLHIHKRLLNGVQPSKAFGQSSFPKEFSLWLAVSHQTGQSTQGFSKLKSYYESSFNKVMARLMALIEPALILVVALFMVVFIMSVVNPLFAALTLTL